MINKTEFLNELKDLLEKHNATISIDYADCSDTHGMIDMHLIIELNNEVIAFEDEWLSSDNVKKLRK